MNLKQDLERELLTAETAFAILEEQGGHRRVPGGLQVALQYANALDDSGLHEDAVELYEGLLADVESWYAGPHQDKDLVRGNLGLALLNVGRFDEAVELTVQAHDGHVARGDDPGAMAYSTRMALTAFLQSGRLEEGVEWSEGLILPSFPEARREGCHLLRGRMLSALGRHDEALAELLPTVDSAAGRVAPGAELVVEALEAVVASLEATGDERAARYREALERQRAAPDADGSR